MTSINQADKSLKKEGQTGVIDNDSLPPVRSAASSEGFSSKVKIVAHIFSSWIGFFHHMV